jgi:hypothetical protein
VTPSFLADRDLDDVARMCLELAGEVWVLRDRIRVLESLLEQSGALPPGAVDAAEPDDELAGRLEHERTRFVERLLGAAVRP